MQNRKEVIRQLLAESSFHDLLVGVMEVLNEDAPPSVPKWNPSIVSQAATAVPKGAPAEEDVFEMARRLR